jgi:hypothetical protein
MRTNRDDPQAVSMENLKVRIPLFKFIPELPDTKVATALTGIVQHNDALRAHLREPRVEIVRDRFVRVVPINMEKVYGPIGKLSDCVIERGLEQAREFMVSGIVMRL